MEQQKCKIKSQIKTEKMERKYNSKVLKTCMPC